jgi:hypothetical protein
MFVFSGFKLPCFALSQSSSCMVVRALPLHPRDRAVGTQWIGGWASFRAGQDNTEVKILGRTPTYSQPYQIFWEVVGLEQGPLSLVSTIKELPRRKSSGCGLGIREYGGRDPSRWPRGTLHPQKLALISPTATVARGLWPRSLLYVSWWIWETEDVSLCVLCGVKDLLRKTSNKTFIIWANM